MREEFLEWLCNCPVKFTSGEILEDTNCEIKEYWFYIPTDDEED